MKPNLFKFSVLTVGVAAAMGLSTGANAGIDSGETSNGAAAINNQATATYSIGDGANAVVQPKVVSNTVTVSVTETAKFTLLALNGTSATDDKNENIATTPNGSATFNHTLKNDGNVRDTYTITTTGENDLSITTAAPTYALASAPISYTIDVTALTVDQRDSLKASNIGMTINVNQATGTINSGGTITLLPKLTAALSYTLTTPDNLGGSIGVGTFTATSTFFTNAGATQSTLVNENQTIVILPTFKITKAATCTNAPSTTTAACSTLDLTAATPNINYSITVANVVSNYSATATDFVIRDVLPAGMTLANGATSVTTTNGTVTAINVANSPQVIDVAVASLAAGSNLVITFQVNVNKATYAGANASATNNVAVYDKFVGAVGTLPASPTLTTDYDILDSTVTANDATRIPTAADASGGVGEDTASTVKFSRRNLTLAEATTREIAPLTSTTDTKGQVTHVATITNSGQDIEGNSTNPLTLTITDGSNAEVNPVLSQFFLVYTSLNGGTPTQPYLVTPTQSGNVYTISSSTFPGNLGIEPGGKLEVRYNMESTAINGSPGTGATIGSTESTVVKLTAGGINAPTIAAITDTTNVRGLTLDKFQALDANCDGNPTTAAVSKDPVNGAKPDQCIIYRINATNTSSPIQTSNSAAASGFNITALEIKDLFSNFAAGANFIMNSATSSATTNSTIAKPIVVADTSVAATASTLAPQGIATLNFKVKIKNAR